MVGLTEDEKIEMNLSYFESLSDGEILEQWEKIKKSWGENPQSVKPVNQAIFDYILNYRLPLIHKGVTK